MGILYDREPHPRDDFCPHLVDPTSSTATHDGRPGTTGTVVPVVPRMETDMTTRGGAAAAANDEAKLRAEVRRVSEQLRADNPDVVPSQQAIAKAMKRRKAHVGAAMRWLERAEMRERAKLEAIPDMPQALLQEWDALKKRLWIAANEVSTPVIAELRRASADERALHERQQMESDATLAETEDELEAERARAEAAETALSASQQALAAAQEDLRAAVARNEELRAVLAMLGQEAPRARSLADQSTTPQRRDRRSDRAEAAITPSLPGISFEPAASADPAE